jgi:hypothetical protein
MNEMSKLDEHLMQQVLQCFNIVVKHALKHKDYQQVGRFPKFFLANDQRSVTNIDQPKLKYWPGYELTSKATRSGIFLNIDSCTKFIMQDTILEQYYMH